MRDHYFIISLFNNDCVVPLKKDKIVCVEDYKSIESKRGFFGKVQHMYMKWKLFVCIYLVSILNESTEKKKVLMIPMTSTVQAHPSNDK